MPAVLVLTTVPDAKTASRISRKLVEKRLAACVSAVGGVSSVYRWKGKIENAAERLLLIKTSAARYGALEKFLASIHPYESPEILAVPVKKGLPKYLKWIGDSTK
jgi:periplasmic divalent cation tolerance protein